jgi:hypothetical protein
MPDHRALYAVRALFVTQDGTDPDADDQSTLVVDHSERVALVGFSVYSEKYVAVSPPRDSRVTDQALLLPARVTV